MTTASVRRAPLFRLTKYARVAVLMVATACGFQAPDTNQPLGCACDPVPNQFVYCDFAACRVGDCKPGYVDLDRDPSNGCEATFDALPGNVKARLDAYYSVDIASSSGMNSEYLTYTIGGFVSITSPDLPCDASTAHPCSYRLEALQIELEDTVSPTWTGLDAELDNGMIATTGPVDGVDTGEGAIFANPGLLVGFSSKSERSVFVPTSESLDVTAIRSRAGTVTVRVNGSVAGTIYGAFVELSFFDGGVTPVIYPPMPISTSDAGTDASAETGTEAGTDAELLDGTNDP